MGDTSIPENILQPLFSASESSTLEKSLEILVEKAKTPHGRSDLASKNILPIVIQCLLSNPSDQDIILLSLKLLRNLCAGEILNQNLLIEQNNVEIVSSVLSSVRFESDSDCGIIRMGLQLLGNVSLGGGEHQCAVWNQFYPKEFLKISGIRKRETCDPLCMVIYTCSDGSNERLAELCGDKGLHIIAEIVRTTSIVGFGEDWFKLLISRICLDDFHFPDLFSTIRSFDACEKIVQEPFVSEQAFLLQILSEILNERIRDITIYNDFALCALGIFKKALAIVDFSTIGNSSLPTSSTDINILGYSVNILRDICALDGLKCSKEGSVDVVESLLSAGLLDIFICLLRDLEPPSIVKKAVKQSMNQESGKPCPYKGFRRDIVAVIGNCAYGKKHVQDEIRLKNGLLLMLQQCVTDEDNPYLREWGIWAVKNLLEGNEENQRLVAELEIQESVGLPELTGMGLRVEIDKEARRAKLVNIA